MAIKKRWSLPKYYAMIDWWEENGPPVYVGVAAYLGLIKKKSSSKKSNNLNELAKMFSGSSGIIQ